MRNNQTPIYNGPSNYLSRTKKKKQHTKPTGNYSFSKEITSGYRVPQVISQTSKYGKSDKFYPKIRRKPLNKRSTGLGKHRLVINNIPKYTESDRLINTERNQLVSQAVLKRSYTSEFVSSRYS